MTSALFGSGGVALDRGDLVGGTYLLAKQPVLLFEVGDLRRVGVALASSVISFRSVAGRAFNGLVDLFSLVLDLGASTVVPCRRFLKALDMGSELVEKVAISAVEVLSGDTGFGGQRGGVEAAVGVNGTIV